MFKTSLCALTLAGCAVGAQAAWTTTGDALVDAGTLTLTSAFTGAGDPDRFFNVSGTPAVEVGVLEATLELPAYALDLPSEQYGTEGSAAWQRLAVAAGDTLRFDWSFTTRENDFEDHAFVSIGDQVLTLATRSQPGAPMKSLTHVFDRAGSFMVGVGVIDTVDYLGVSTLAVSGLTLTPAVPEPGTVALWLAGAAALGLSRRGRRAAAPGRARARRRTRSGSYRPPAARAVPR